MSRSIVNRPAWAVGFLEISRLLPPTGLQRLAEVLRQDSRQLLRGYTSAGTKHSLSSEDCTAACPIGYAVWQGLGLRKVCEVLTAFEDLTARCPTANDFVREWDCDRVTEDELLALVEEILEERCLS